jgi:hypothetical protein
MESSRPAGGSFGAPQAVSSVAADVVLDFNARFDAAGNAWLAWVENAGGSYRPFVATAPPGGPFGASQPLDAAGSTNEVDPQVVFDTQGDAVAAWQVQPAPPAPITLMTAAKPAGGTWGAAQMLSESGQTSFDLALGMSPEGAALALWAEPDRSLALMTASRPKGGTWSAPVVFQSNLVDDPRLAFDGQGNAAAVWNSDDGSHLKVRTAGFDGAGPRLNSLVIPTSGTVGHSLDFSVAPFDVWSTIASTTWDFGDGSQGSGTSVSHTYTAPGNHTVTVTATDSVGNASTATGNVAVAGPPDTTITKATINVAKHKATFTFTSNPTGTDFQCELKKGTKKASFSSCASPKTYKNLSPGNYAFFVRAVGSVGADPTPAKNTFTL